LDKSLTLKQIDRGCRVQWTVDAKKLRGSDKQVVSPPFEVALQPSGNSAAFKVMLYPKAEAGMKGGVSFRKAAGVGQVQLKCCSELPEAQRTTSVRITVGSGDKAQPSRGPFPHEFGPSSVFNAPKDQAYWDFGASVEHPALTFTVEVELTQVA
jgi:hypothetical protein